MRRLLGAATLLSFAVPSFAAFTCAVSATGAAFGTYDPLSAAPSVTTATVTMSCTLLSPPAAFIPYSIGLSTGSSGSYAARQLVNSSVPAERIAYNLYRNAAYTQVWGDGSGGTVTVTGLLRVRPARPTDSNMHTVYGRAAGGQDVRVGNYADVITVTVTY